MARVCVVGAGVIGLTVAHELAAGGHDVEVLAAHDHTASVSSVAAAIWFPHAVDRSRAVLDSAAATYARLLDLSADPATGVRMRWGTVLSRRPDPDLSWTDAVPSTAAATEVPAGATGVRCRVPLAVTGAYLAWLRARVAALGARFTTRALAGPDDLAALDGDAVVVAAGLGSAVLLGDDEPYPIRGQVVRLANPGLREWVTDEDNPAGLTYVVPRDDDVVCGGTGDVGSWDVTVRPDVEAAILARATALVPALAGRPVLGRATGLRPARPAVRLGPVTGHGRPTVACYGHGGAGFTLSWGDAARVADLLRS